jgi:hypothetical protein
MTQLTYVEKAPNILLGAVVEPRIKVIACECAEQATPLTCSPYQLTLFVVDVALSFFTMGWRHNSFSSVIYLSSSGSGVLDSLVIDRLASEERSS